jgi:hypothetical protein
MARNENGSHHSAGNRQADADQWSWTGREPLAASKQKVGEDRQSQYQRDDSSECHATSCPKFPHLISPLGATPLTVMAESLHGFGTMSIGFAASEPNPLRGRHAGCEKLATVKTGY